MKKVIVTRENYEEVMFNLLENEYPSDVRENILDQIHADTFLAFEWSQWSKASYSESTEKYKEEEAEFLESLTREDDSKKGGIFTIYRTYSLAAAIALLIGLSVIFFYSKDNTDPNFTDVNRVDKPLVEGSVEKTEVPENASVETNDVAKMEVKRKDVFSKEEIVQTPVNPISNSDTLNKFVIEQENWKNHVKDTIREMIAKAISKPTSKYKVSIVESRMDNSQESTYVYAEKRYTMADLLVKKDGITLSKFLDNSKSKVIKTNNTTYIEYIAADMSVLVLTLSN